ncbi:metal-responsive CopG/Arc/MetJ family transcriptional regulator [Salirhabdus euzebyi]|uniref:Metal-responsive CopG/Arc/MetJ family transcriptional regulator n=1 Tax=Salirhabdus euzebyi TaxID=394506 RepID=A0A841Q8Q5_9BACI|nr:hypothetical protein [Salirhabdus euzebyi]MBB6454788.1 metal-responsive CopG/Arc/MetJ family transcriptional regulator [Salirhabdus euzebyi]
MQKTKLIIILAIVLIFFFIVNLDTKGYLLSSDTVNYEELDLLIDEIGSQSELSREEVIREAIDFYFQSKALSEEAAKRGFEVSDQELQDYAEQMIETVKQFGPEMLGPGFEAFLAEKNLTIEEFFYRNYQGNRLRQQMLIQKLHQDIFQEQTNDRQDFEHLEETIEAIIDSYKQKHRFEMKKVQKHYHTD